MAITPCTTTCTCVPYSNQCCCAARGSSGEYRGISVTQPTCQTVPTGTYTLGDPIVATQVSPNPCANPGGISFWTYKFITDCRSGLEGTNAISHVNIPVCSTLTTANIAVYEKIDGCGNFTLLGPDDVSLKESDPSCDPDVFPPTGFQFLKIENNGRFGKGVCVTYLIAILGNVDPTPNQTIVVKSNVCLFAGGGSFACEEGCFTVPGCGKVNVNVEKLCTSSGDTITYTINLTGGPATVLFTDQLTIPAGITLLFQSLPAGCTASYNGNPVGAGSILVGPGTLTITCITTVPTSHAFVFKVLSAPVADPKTLINTVNAVVSTDPRIPIVVTGLPATICTVVSAAVLSVCTDCTNG